MTPQLLNKIKKMINQIKETPQFLGPSSLDALWSLENLIFEVEDYWKGIRVSRQIKEDNKEVS